MERTTSWWSNLDLSELHGENEHEEWELDLLIARTLRKHVASGLKKTEDANVLRMDSIQQKQPDLVHLGHRMRPLRDGGGKPSKGRSLEEHRLPPSIKSIGSILSRFVDSEGLEESSKTTMQLRSRQGLKRAH